MISKADVIDVFERAKADGNLDYVYDRTTDSIYDKDGVKICTLDEYMPIIRRKYHCDFESIFYCHATLDDVYRCRECGTVIFGGDDERYDPNCKCPVCCQDDSVCQNHWWSGEEIAADPEKQKAIEGYIQAQKDMDDMYARQKARNGLRDSEIWKKRYYGKKNLFEFCLGCDDLFRTKLKGLLFKINYSRKNDDDIGYIWKREIVIPLSISAAVMYWYRLPRYRRQWRKEHENVL